MQEIGIVNAAGSEPTLFANHPSTKPSLACLSRSLPSRSLVCKHLRASISSAGCPEALSVKASTRKLFPSSYVRTEKKSCRYPCVGTRTRATVCETDNVWASSPKTLYDWLTVPQEAKAKDIKAAFRHLALKFHPDVVSIERREECTETFRQIQAAYAVLADPIARARYDKELLMKHQQVAHPISFPSCRETAATESLQQPRVMRRWHKKGSWETDQCW